MSRLREIAKRVVQFHNAGDPITDVADETTLAEIIEELLGDRGAGRGRMMDDYSVCEERDEVYEIVNLLDDGSVLAQALRRFLSCYQGMSPNDKRWRLLAVALRPMREQAGE